MIVNSASNNIDLTIIIPTYNRRHLIDFTLRSLEAGFHPGINFEIIIVDDASTDNTIEHINANYPEVRLLSNTGKGASSARNVGLDNSNGDYILYLDSDDLIGAGYFLNKIKFLNDHTNIEACYGEYDFFKSDGEFDDEKIVFKHKYPLVQENVVSQHLYQYLSGSFLPPHSIIWRKSFLKKIKGHNPQLLINQDVDLIFRALFNNAQIHGIVENTRVYVREHNTDDRVGVAKSSTVKYKQILEIRQECYKRLLELNYEKRHFEALSHYLFSNWRTLRHIDKDLAGKYLELAKNVYWPIYLNGNVIFKWISKVLGPVKATKVKYLLFNRDL